MISRHIASPSCEPAVRFAPTPNGYLHLGHALSALTVADFARVLGARLEVRIEDLDPQRTRPDYVAQIFDDLRWLGLTWEQPVLMQSKRAAAYRCATQALDEMGVLYRCYASRAEIATAAAGSGFDPDGVPLYPGHRRVLPAAETAARRTRGEPFALRLDMVKALAIARARLGGATLAFTEIDRDGSRRAIEADPARWGDVLLVRKDAPASYHLAVVVDDAFQDISHVTRGQDLYEATHLHRLLQVLLALPEPVYHHHTLVVDANGRKLAKSDGDTSLLALRRDGATVEDIRTLTNFEALSGHSRWNT